LRFGQAVWAYATIATTTDVRIGEDYDDHTLFNPATPESLVVCLWRCWRSRSRRKTNRQASRPGLLRHPSRPRHLGEQNRHPACSRSPPRCRGIARHGSWNRTKKIGGDVVVAKLNKNGTVKSIEPFLTGFLQNNAYLGRPVDVQVMKDGSLLVSDDYAGAVYRVTYGTEGSAKR